jgi:hypothetical protein
MTATTTNRPTSLDEVLAYRHPAVLRRYAEEQHAPLEEAEEVFREMLKFLYVCHRAATELPSGLGYVVSTEIEKIDWMWHTFLLFTMDYADFCERHFGHFLHHVPGEAATESEAPVDGSTVRAQVERQFALVYDLLGEETLIAWYDQCRYAAPA